VRASANASPLRSSPSTTSFIRKTLAEIPHAALGVFKDAT